MRPNDAVSAKPLVSLALCAALLVGLGACSGDEEQAAESQSEANEDAAPKERSGAVAVQPHAPQIPTVQATADMRLDKVLAGPQRTAEERARDVYRHPKETLQFFGIDRGTRIIEITPGEGWYAAILSPFVKGLGSYTAAVHDENVPGVADYTADQNALLQQRFRSDRNSYDGTRPALYRFNPNQPVLGASGSADAVLSFRNAHNWVAEGTAAAHFKGFFDVLKSGGVLGIVDHRANPGPATDGLSGYVTEQQIIELATAAGFRLAAKSEINANPRDTKDHPEGVWTLPPTYALGDVDRKKYQDIGESDRMTLKFAKP